MPCDKMTLCDFRNFFQFFDHGFILVGVVQHDPDEGTYFQSQCPGFDNETGAFDNTGIFHFLYALVDGCTGNSAFPGNFQKRDSGIFNQVGKYFPVYVVDLKFNTLYNCFLCL